MPVSGKERTKRCHERKKQEEEEKLSKCRERQCKQTGEKRKRLRIMAHSPGDESPPAPMETPLRLPPIAELSPARLEALEQSRQRQHLLSRDAIVGIREQTREANALISNIADREFAAEHNYQHFILSGEDGMM